MIKREFLRVSQVCLQIGQHLTFELGESRDQSKLKFCKVQLEHWDRVPPQHCQSLPDSHRTGTASMLRRTEDLGDSTNQRKYKTCLEFSRKRHQVSQTNRYGHGEGNASISSTCLEFSRKRHQVSQTNRYGHGEGNASISSTCLEFSRKRHQASQTKRILPWRGAWSNLTCRIHVHPYVLRSQQCN